MKWYIIIMIYVKELVIIEVFHFKFQLFKMIYLSYCSLLWIPSKFETAKIVPIKSCDASAFCNHEQLQLKP